MNVGIIGNNLTSMTLAKALVNKKVKVTIFYKASLKKVKTNRCIGITSNNLDFFNKKIFKVNKKFLKPINEIKIYLESNLKKETLSFKKNNTSLLNTIKIKDLFLILKRELNYKKNFNEKKVKSYDFLIKNKNYDLIFNCEKRNSLIEKYFYQAHVKDYKSKAITCNLNHKKIINNKAVQIFTKYGPLAFLPLSNYETAVVFSIYNQRKNFSKDEIKNIIKSYNKYYLIKKFSEIEKVKLKFFSARKYHHDNILLFGDILHQIHPLAGQGFNMTLRDLEVLLKIIQSKIELGLNFDESTLEEFEKKVKHFNLIYSSSINFLQDFFKLESKFKNNVSNKVLNLIGQNKLVNNFFTKVADRGININ